MLITVTKGGLQGNFIIFYDIYSVHDVYITQHLLK